MNWFTIDDDFFGLMCIFALFVEEENLRRNKSWICFVFFKVPKAKDEVVEREFNRLLEACSYLAQTLDEDVNGKKQPYSLGDTLEQLIRAQEKAVREKYLQHLREISKMKDSLRTILMKVWFSNKQKNSDLSLHIIDVRYSNKMCRFK